MSAMSFLSGFFGEKKRELLIEDGGACPDLRTGAAARPPSTPQPVHPDAILVREEIIDARNRLCGYRFMPKPLAGSGPCPESWFYEALNEEHIMEFAQHRMAVVPLSADGMFFGRHRQLHAPKMYFQINVRNAEVPHDELVRRVAALHDGGFLVALSGIDLMRDEMPLLQLADLVFLDLAEYLLHRLETTVRDMRLEFPTVELAAENVHSWSEQRMCMAWGFKYCLGDFLMSRDENASETGLNDSQIASMKILNLLRQDADTQEMVEIAKRDPALTFQLLKWSNSPALGLSHPITSVSQAITVLGRAQVYRWLTVAMFRMGSRHEHNESLLELALARARCMETLLAPQLSPAEREELFIVGLLSVFDTLLRMPIDKVVANMHLSDAAADVLLRSTGPYAPYLMLTIEMEKGRAEHIAELASRLGIVLETLERTRSAAYLWAQDSLSASLAT